MDKLDYIYTKKENPKIRNFLFNYFKNKKVILVGSAKYLENKSQKDWIDSFDIVVRIKNNFPPPVNDYEGTKTNLYYTNCKLAQHSLSMDFFKKLPKLDMIIIPYPLQDTKKQYYDPGLFKVLQKNVKEFSSLVQKYQPNLKVPIKSDLDSDYLTMIETKMGTRPTTGLLTILDILQYPIKSLTLTGFTFRKELIDLQKAYLDPLKNENLNQKIKNQINLILPNLYRNNYKTDQQLGYSWEKTLKTECHNLEKEYNFFLDLLKNDPRLLIDDIMKEKLTI